MRMPNATVSYMISETTTKKRNPAPGIMFGIITEGLYWAAIISAEWARSPAARNDVFGTAAVTLTTLGLIGGAAIGGIAAGVGALAGGLTARRTVDWLIGGLIGALICTISGMVLTIWVSRHFALVCAFPQPLLLLGSMLPGILGGVWGASPSTTTRAICAACGEIVQPDAAYCPHCDATFDWSRRVEAYTPADSDDGRRYCSFFASTLEQWAERLSHRVHRDHRR